MSHSGCYGPLPGLGHHILANAAGLSKNSITASKNHMETEKEQLCYLKVPEIPDSTRCPAREGSQVPLLTSLPMVTSVSLLL